MTKQDLLDALATKFYKVGAANPQGNPTLGLQWYLVKVFDKNGDVIRDQNVSFYEDTATGEAYWSPSEPKPTPVSGFQQEINAYIAGKIADGTIEGAFSEQMDITNENAIYMVVMSDLTQKRLFVDRDNNGVLRHRLMV